MVGKPHVRFDERDLETKPIRPPRQISTLSGGEGAVRCKQLCAPKTDALQMGRKFPVREPKRGDMEEITS
jgi:hypothetical protein